jgi:hypothetical protein
LTGVIGFGVYLFMTGRLQPPGQPAIPERGINSEQPSAVAEQKVALTALNSIQARMTLEEVQTKLDVQLKPYSEISYSSLTSDPPWDSAAVYSCVLEDGSSFYLTFVRYTKSDNLVFFAKSVTPPNLMNPGSSN